MKNWLIIIFIVGVSVANKVVAQELQMTEISSLEQIQGEFQISDELIPMNDLEMDDGGYVLYETMVAIDGKVSLEIENVRDYASADFSASEGEHLLQLYVENTGRITYGPEILDNFKGLFGTAELNGEELGSWKISPLSVRTCDVSQLNFSPLVDCSTPCFFRCAFPREKEQELHLDMSGWGMGEVWLNGEYLGSYWERNPQQSLIIQKSMLKEGKNTIVIFELKNKGQDSVKLSDKPVFK